MKILVFIMIMALPSFSFGMCLASPEPNVWPKSGKIPLNPVFIIRQWKYSEWVTLPNEYFSSFILKYPIYLVSKNGDTTELNIRSIYNDNEQCLFIPTKKLEKNQTYILHTPYKTLDDELNYFKSTYSTTNFKDTVIPKWITQPFLTETVYKQFGCGDDKLAKFSSTIDDQSNCIVFVRIFEQTTQRTFTYYLSQDEGNFEVGKYMCGGDYHFNDDSNYQLEFGLMDASGNFSGQITETYYLNGDFTSKTYSVFNQNKVKSDDYHIRNMKIISFILGGLFFIVLVLGLVKR